MAHNRKSAGRWIKQFSLTQISSTCVFAAGYQETPVRKFRGSVATPRAVERRASL
jgi:hypothetical protein